MTPIEVPDLGAPAAFGLWHLRVGDRVTAGDRVAEVLIAGAVVDLAAPAGGVLAACAARPGDPLPPGTVIGAIEDTEGEPPA